MDVLHTRQTARGNAVLVVIIGVAFLVAAYFVIRSFLASPAPNVTVQVYSGSLVTPRPFPPTVAGSVTLDYDVKSRNETRPSGAGMGYPPLNVSPYVPEKNIPVTFNLANGNALFANGTKTQTVNTNGQGRASVTLAPAVTGSDTLSFSMRVGSSAIADSETFNFEVVKNP